MTESAGRAPRLPQVAAFVERLWYVRDPDCGGWELKLPTTTAQVIINLDAERLSARSVRPDQHPLTCGAVGLVPISPAAQVLDRTEQRRTAGIVIRPEAVGAVAGGSADDLDALVDLDAVINFGAERLAAAAAAGRSAAEVLDLLEAELTRLLAARAEPDAGCRTAIGLLRRGHPVTAVADQLGISQSTLTRRFRTAVGMLPKRYYRLLRIERAIGLTAHQQHPDWAAVAVRAGCYDQAHLIHEFDELTGLTPARWHQAVAADPHHLRLDDDFLQAGTRSGGNADDHERSAVSRSHAVPALSRR